MISCGISCASSLTDCAREEYLSTATSLIALLQMHARLVFKWSFLSWYGFIYWSWRFYRPGEMLSRRTRTAYANGAGRVVCYGWNVILGTSVTADCGANCGSLHPYQYVVLIWSRVKTIPCSHIIFITAREVNQLLPFINWQLMLFLLNHMSPAAAASPLRFHSSVFFYHCQSRLGFLWS